MPVDKRILKTKRNLKSTLIRQLNEIPFEKITVSELCREAQTSRITFYTYYDDKYALIDELLHDYYEEASVLYHELQGKNNPQYDDTFGYMNLLDCILRIMEQNNDFFRHISPERNPYLTASFYRYIFDSVNDYILRHQTQLKPRYPSSRIAALICGGGSSLMYEAILPGANAISARQDLQGMFRDLLRSDLFEHLV